MKFYPRKKRLFSNSQINCIIVDFAKQLSFKIRKVFVPLSRLNGTSKSLNYKIKTMQFSAQTLRFYLHGFKNFHIF